MAEQLKKMNRRFYRLSEAVEYLTKLGVNYTQSDLLHLGALGEIEFIAFKPSFEDRFNMALLPSVITEVRYLENDNHPINSLMRFETEERNKRISHTIIEFDFFAVASLTCMNLSLYGKDSVPFSYKLFNENCEPLPKPDISKKELADGWVERETHHIIYYFLRDFDLALIDSSTEKGREAIEKCVVTYELTADNLLITKKELDRYLHNETMEPEQSARIKGVWPNEILQEAYKRYKSRKVNGETQEDIAKYYGVSRQTFVNRMEKYEQQQRFTIGNAK